MALDFKINFHPDKSESIDALHDRVAKRIHALCVTNGGLYVKLAQSLAIQTAILPKPYREAFANVFDAAPTVPFDQVVKVRTALRSARSTESQLVGSGSGSSARQSPF
jgi:aarF domain-containing kinase